MLVGARRECPLVVGRGEHESFVASAVPAFLAHTRRVQYIENDEIVDPPRRLGRDLRRHRGVARSAADRDDRLGRGDRGEGRLRDVHAQGDPRAGGRARGDDRRPHRARRRRRSRRSRASSTSRSSTGSSAITIVSCGTSYHAGLLGRYAIEEWARMHVDVDVASEYRYRNPIVGPDDLVVGISQSGETADTLAAMRLARERGGGRVLALTNAMGSQATRDADAVLLHARRARDRRRGDEDLRLPGRRVLPAGPAPRRAARDARPGADRRARCGAATAAAARRGAARARARRRSRRSPSGAGRRRLLPLHRPPGRRCRSRSRAR